MLSQIFLEFGKLLEACLAKYFRNLGDMLGQMFWESGKLSVLQIHEFGEIED